ncbi:response regulator transcription factor [Arenimonas composti]|uniref:Response regulatory domain-containing protein n=1 Tax=Arenimonas composti TR7-09 = DSM 18010 TaxID=1121013 RepID=A0A091BXD6_9GAMM|nr:response regulator [Arenimonas composti]KFN49000.1 hypothetical protein P873_12710 [Arenimonas composti TR7-09 = DSM 18010]
MECEPSRVVPTAPGAAPDAPRRLLLLEDDPTIAAFVMAVLAAPALRIDHAPDLASARTLATPAQALWLFDVRLPDGDAAALLHELRARGLATPALALTADAGSDEVRRLRTAGFAAVLAKPLPASTLRAAVSPWLGEDWDDAAATRALGDAGAVATLRRLFLAELPDECRRLRAERHAGDHAAVRARLHRLLASCGYVGAPALQARVRVLAAMPDDDDAFAGLEAAAARLLADA